MKIQFISSPQRLMRRWGWVVASWITLTCHAQGFSPFFAWQAIAPPVTTGSRTELDFNQLLKLSPTRYVQIGISGYYPDPIAPNVYREAPHLLFFDALGNTLNQVQLLYPFPYPAVYDGVSEPDGSFLTLGYARDSIGAFADLLHFDSVGTLQWQHKLRVPGHIPTIYTPQRVPDGYILPLVIYEEQPINGIYRSYVYLLKIDRQGQQQWAIQREAYSVMGAYGVRRSSANITPLRDGSYILCYQDLSKRPSPQNVPWDYDNHLLRFSASGDTLASRLLLTEPNLQDIGYYTAPTTDGGLLLSGARRLRYPAADRHRRGYLVKLDSLLAPQWTFEIDTLTLNGKFYSGSEFVHTQQLANGHVRVLGYITELLFGGPDYRTYGLAMEIAPPTAPGDTLGHIVNSWFNPFGWAHAAIAQADGSAVVSGCDWPNWSQAVTDNRYRAKWTGLGLPAPYELCATPPAALHAQAGPLAGSSLTFWADSTRSPGPVYGQWALVSWDFGDGSTAEGWQVRHTFSSPAPVAVRVRAQNNLGCARDTVLYPFGVPTGLEADGQAPTASFWPNPSATGRFAVQLSGTGSVEVTVVNAVGQQVQRASWVAGSPELDLSRQPAGVYAVRLRWADGRTLTRRLVRW